MSVNNAQSLHRLYTSFVVFEKIVFYILNFENFKENILYTVNFRDKMRWYDETYYKYDTIYNIYIHFFQLQLYNIFCNYILYMVIVENML